MSQGSYWRSQFSFEYVAHEGLKSLRGRSSSSCRVCRKEPHRRALVKQPSKRNGCVHRTCDFRNREFMQRPAPHRLPAHQLQVFLLSLPIMSQKRSLWPNQLQLHDRAAVRVGHEVLKDHGPSEGQQRDRPHRRQFVASGRVALQNRRRRAVQQYRHEHSSGHGPNGGPGRRAEGVIGF